MANVKISELPAATLPLDGTEAVPIVQAGETVQAPAIEFGPLLPLTVPDGGTGITSGTSGGVPYFSASGTISSSGALTINRIVLGGGAGAAPTVLGSLGTSTTVLHGNAGGAPSFGAVSLTADVTGNLPVTNLNSGTSASASTFWRGDATWAGVDLAAVTGTLPLANGGTGQTTAENALIALLPDQATHGGEFLTTDGSTPSWAAGGSLVEPEDQLVYGTGASVTSSASYTYEPDTNQNKQYALEAPFALARRAVLSNTTTDDTPALLYVDPLLTSLLFVRQGGDTAAVWGLRIVVSAINSISGADAATFHIEGTVFFNAGTFDVEILGSTTTTARATAGAAAWDAELVVDGAVLAIQVTGAVDTPIQWGALADGMHIGASVA